MILNLYGPSGSGKTTLVKKIIKSGVLNDFYSFYCSDLVDLTAKSCSISLMPLPTFRGTVKDYFFIFSSKLQSIEEESFALRKLYKSIFKSQDFNHIENHLERDMDTLSAGELRRLHILRSLLSGSDLNVIDEPFANSDEKLKETIFKAINESMNLIICTHQPINVYLNREINNLLPINIIDAREYLNRFSNTN